MGIEKIDDLSSLYNVVVDANQLEPVITIDVRVWNGYPIGLIKITGGLDDMSAAEMINVLADFAFCSFIDLDNNELTDEGAKSLADAMNKRKFTVLSLSGNQISDEGVKALEAAAKTNKTFAFIIEGTERTFERAILESDSWILPFEADEASFPEPFSFQQ